MFIDAHQKVSAEHLRRNAFLYIRQSSLRQVFENTESSKRQYALRDRAVSLGWPIEHIYTIDTPDGVRSVAAACLARARRCCRVDSSADAAARGCARVTKP